MQTQLLKKRKSIRLSDYDYSKNGLYFITICTKNRECIFGEIKNHEMILSEIGQIVNKQIGFSPWQRNYYEHIIRSELEYLKIANYIIENPLKWNDNVKMNAK